MIGTTIKSAWPIESITVRAYCKCGDAIHTSMNSLQPFEFVMEAFADDHQGENHGSCDAKTARKARRKREREVV